MRVQPRPLYGLIAFLAYLVVFNAAWIISDIHYKDISLNADTVWKWYVVPLALGAAALVAMTTWMGWWRPAMFERQKAVPRWLMIGPVMMAVFAAVTLPTKDYSDTTMAMFWLIVLGSLLVGFCEELATRGLLLTGLRGAYSEPKAWFLSTLAFGLLHLPNWFYGVGPAATAQVFLAFMSGTMLYLLRRLSGTLIWAMLLHGFWDFSSFIGKDAATYTYGFVLLNGALALFLVWKLFKHDQPSPALTDTTVPDRTSPVPS